MGKRKQTDGDVMDGDNCIPIPIQSFLWRQTSPFIRSKLGKLCDASCMSFERVLAQNILHGLSPSLCEAIQEVSRWKLIQAALPHVMHCCAAALRERKINNPDAKFTSNESKLLYTLHWILLDAASECEDNESDQGLTRSFYWYLHSLDTIQLFIYLFAPLIDSLKEPDFESLKLENGLRLWQPLWDHCHPDVPCFSTPVKAKRVVLKAHRNLMKVNFNMANIYIGKGTSTDNIYLGPPDDNMPLPSPGGSYEASTPRAPIARLSDICALSTTATEASVEILCELCNETLQNRNGDLSCSCGTRRTSVTSAAERKSLGLPSALISPVDKEYITKRLETAAASGMMRSSPNPDVLSASYLDVAVMRCLFCPQWSEEGVYWGLRFIHRRLLEISDELNRVEYTRERSRSLPIPDVQITPPTEAPPSTPSSPKKDDLMSCNDALKLFANRDPHEHIRKEPSFKKVKVSEIKSIIGDKVKQLVHRESCDHFDLESCHKPSKEDSERSTPDILSSEGEQRYNSAVGRVTEADNDSPGSDQESYESSSDIVRRKSMPALRRHKRENMVDEDEDSSGSGKGPSGLKDGVARALSLKPELLNKPIITITQDSPDPGHNAPSWFSSKRDSLVSDRSDDLLKKPVTIQRSYTDSNIRYNNNDEIEEVPGSVHYIQSNGQLNYGVILMAAYGVAGRECSPRITGVLLNLINCLLDLGVVEKREVKKKPKKKEEGEENEPGKDGHKNEKENNPKKDDFLNNPKDPGKTQHTRAMETMIRIFKMIGCPHGCGDGYRGNTGEHLRTQAIQCITRLMNINMPQFKRFVRNSLMKQPLQDVMDFLHALLGFCVDPGFPTSPTGLGCKKSGLKEGQTGYANNFGEPYDGGPTIQGQLIVQITKPLVSKFVENKKELNSHDNVGLYCDIRQFINYLKEIYGGTFRKVALSCLRETLKIEPVYAKETTSGPKNSKVIRRNMSITSETGEERAFREAIAAVAASMGSDDSSGRGSRRSIFRRRGKKSMLPSHGALSDSEMLDDFPSRSGRLSPRVSMSATEDDPPSGPSTPKRKFSKFNIATAWRRAAKSDHEEELISDSPGPEIRKESKPLDAISHLSQAQGQNHNQTPVQTPGRQKKMSFKAAGQATLSFLTARKRVEDGNKNRIKKPSSKRGSIEEVDLSRRGSHEHAGNHMTERVLLREKRLVQSYAVKSGLLRFNFMLDCCQPGALPDPHLIAALMDLEAPVVGRAALLLECAHFVNRCNRGEWPNWMKLNLPGFRQMGLLPSRGQPSGQRRNIQLQRLAGAMFHQWGEALANRLYDIMTDEAEDKFNILHQVKDDSKKKELRTQDEEENFMDEATVNPTGKECPYALRMVACQLLLEITTFLRETYQCLPKSKLTKRQNTWDKPASSRRWSSVLSSPGHSERSNSRSSQGEMGHLAVSSRSVSSRSSRYSIPDNPVNTPMRKVSFVVVPDPERSHSVPYVTIVDPRTASSPSDRKISFAVFGERSDSIHSSTTTISQLDVSAESKTTSAGRRIGPGGRKLLKTRRGSGHNSSFRNQRSFKLKRPEEGGSIKRVGSVKARKVSTQSLQSAVSFDEGEPQVMEQLDETEAGTLSDEQQDSPEMLELDDHDYSKYMPWIKVVVQIANTSNFICEHQNYCHPNCYERQRRSCIRLMTAIQKIYDSEPPKDDGKSRGKMADRRDTLKDQYKRRESMFQPSSPTRRRESTPLLDKIKTDTSLSLKLKMVMAQEKKAEKSKKQKPKDELPIQKYLKTQAQNLTHCTLSVITKATPILADESFVDMMPVAWELLLESDQELAAAAATVFILASVKVPAAVQEMMSKQLQHEDVNQRINAILRFGVLWRFRYQIWPRMEDGANMYFKVPPPSIDFVLPSPTIGLPNLQMVDPPWQPHFKTKVEEVTINHEESKSFVTATTTRRKEQQEMIHRALLAEEDRRRSARENFLMTTIPIMQQAAYEPALHHVTEDHEEAAITEEISLAARRMSVAPANRQSNLQSRNVASGRHGSMFWIGRPTIYEGEEERMEHTHSHHLQLAQHFFPSCISKAALPIIHLLEDLEVNGDGISVCEVAEKTIWMCLVEDPTLFLRTFLEKLTTRGRQEELIFLLRKLVHHMPELPAQTGHCLFNYLVGFIMFYVRSPAEGGQEAISEALSVLWQVVPSVMGIYFKDLKQTLRKEQCDPTLLVTANVPSAKKLIVHGPDLTSIPSQFPIHEDTQFCQILQDSLDFFNIPDEEHHCYFLIDTKTNQMHNLNSYVRDFYFFRRNHYPQLSLVHMNHEAASTALQRQAFTQKFAEMGKVLFTLAILEGSHGQQHQNHIAFLHEELLKLPSFPRKALETDFGLFTGGMGKEVYGMDMLHKYVWTKLMLKMFKGMSSTITYSGDLPLFLNVINGTLFLHAEDTAMLKMTMATYINAAKHFKQVFATTGFLFIMPTILRVYSNHQANPIVCETIEFTCRQFFLLHRNPFMLQMFGSIAPILDMNDDPLLRDCSKVDPKALFNLLLALEKDIPDKLQILEMVEGERCNLSALDFCYIDDPDTFTLIDAVNLCVTVVSYASDSARAMQMLVILEAILPFYLDYLKEQTDKKDKLDVVRRELETLSSLGVSMRALICSSESLTRNFSGPQRQLESVNTNAKPTQNHSNHSPQGPTIYCDEHSDIRFLHMEEGLARGRRHMTAVEDEAEASLKEFRKPRNSLLCVVAQFYSHSANRVKDLKRSLADPTIRTQDLLDHKAHTRLADIANTLLKIAPYDPSTMKLKGLQRYMVDILPITDWSQESVRPALNMVLRRLERLFSKIYKKPVLRRYLDWDAASNLLKGVHATLAKFSFIAHLPHLKTLINVCLNIILSDEVGISTGDSLHSVQHGRPDSVQDRINSPPGFSSAVIKLTAMQMQALGDLYSLEHLCGGMSVFPTIEKTVNILVNLVLPLVLRMGSGRRDCPRMRQVDIDFALSAVLHALAPPNKQVQTSSSSSKAHQLAVSDISRSPNAASPTVKKYGPRDMLQNVAFLGLKILIVCFEQHLSTEWFKIVNTVQEIGGKLLGGIPLWRFIDFIVTTRSPIFMMLQPFIQFKMMKAMCETEQEYFLQHIVHQKLHGHNLPAPKSKGTILIELAAELKHFKSDSCPLNDSRPRSSTIATDRSDYSGRRMSSQVTYGLSRSSSIHDLIDQQVAARLNPVTPSLPLGGKYMRGPHGVSPLVHQLSQSSDGPSPALLRKSSTRISAREGSLILEKYASKSTLQEDDNEATSPLPRGPLRVSHSSNTLPSKPCKLQRQPSFYQRAHITKQHSLFGSQDEPPILENVEAEMVADTQADTVIPLQPPPPTALRRSSTLVTSPTQPPASPSQHSNPKFQRRDCIIRRGRFAKQQAMSFDSSFVPYCEDLFEFGSQSSTDNEESQASGVELAPHRPRRQIPPPLVPPSEEDQNPEDSGGLGVDFTAESETEHRGHRLQRQDAKSRKTFKIKRHRSTIKGNVMRSATVKGTVMVSGNPHGLVSPHGLGSPRGLGSPVGLMKMTLPAEFGDGALESQPEEGLGVVDSSGEGDQSEAEDPTADGALTEEQSDVSSSPQRAPPVESHAETSLIGSVRAARMRFLPKSRSHDDGSDVHIAGGTARGRIARQSARLMRSRSPSLSPSRVSQASHVSESSHISESLLVTEGSPLPQTYLTRTDSTESLNTEENAALLKKEEKSQSRSSLLIFFDGNDRQDHTCV